ncbi:transcriptional regulator, AraC family [Jannaschia faecimaris]|uniref:Transcriptional regulator, AraC family n=1 Tax=Jannaschia faecimaris TaxID=1244108 RepID=A0A1H3U726_9RHOB|nr:AraC family transcriptional regulator [Jannaschia faecimaris]SDZ58303.1 transcriptional regulator, AraC family [Jannaschia faecimaris]
MSEQDFLSEMLRSVRLSGALFFEVDAAAPWVAAAPPKERIAPTVVSDARHVIEYHVIVEGTCWTRLTNPNGPPIALGPGSVVVFPHGDTHVLASDPGLDAEPSLAAFDEVARGRSLPFHIDHRGGRTGTTRLLCGFLGCDVAPFNPLISALPRVIHVPDGYESGDGFLGSLIAAAARETDATGAGSDGVLVKLSELIFIEVIRRHAASIPDGADGWLAGLRDPAVGRALRLLHGDPARSWTVGALAREAGVSRSVLAERFTTMLGMPPMTYLSNWRMQRAASLIKGGAVTIAQIAEQVGYESEASFSRAFKRATGLSPAHWRQGASVD